MRSLLLGCTISLAALCTSSYALTPTWISGTPELGSGGPSRSSGLGVVHPLDNPGSSSKAPSWVDSQGNLWLYRIPEDMWRYTPSTNVWTRMNAGGGPQTSGGTFGGGLTQATWLGSDDSLWMIDFVHYWRYDTQSNTWGLMGEHSVFLTTGTLGVPSTANSPGHRAETVTWTDHNNNVYLFGGQYATAGSELSGQYGHDMWKYDTSDGTWVWLSGGFNAGAVPVDDAVHGQKGVFHPDNHPTGFKYSEDAATWVDGDNNLWYFDEDVLWKYDVTINQWAWMAGTDALFGEPVYGTQGVADAANNPGARRDPLTWVGTDGNLWLFGGDRILSPHLNNSSVADLWKFDIAAGAWAWMAGLQDAPAQSHYAAIGVVDPANYPGSRSRGTIWVHPTGTVYMFSGGVVTYEATYNDTWSFDQASGLWTFWKGAAGKAAEVVQGTEDVPHPDNSPGPLTINNLTFNSKRYVNWTDSLGNLWMLQNGLWKFDPAIRQWTYTGGAGASPSVGPAGVESNDVYPAVADFAWTAPDGYSYVYNILGLYRFNPQSQLWAWMGAPDPSSKPRKRVGAAWWVDDVGNVWMFGGRFGVLTPGCEGWVNFPFSNFYLNDLWRLDVQTVQWTQVQVSTGETEPTPGSCFADRFFGDPGNYGTMFQPAISNRPSTRWNATSWNDGNGNLWLFGGDGYTPDNRGRLNDMWKYELASGMWTWMGGTNTVNAPDSYGLPDTPDIANAPGGRYGAAGWADGNKLLMHGGAPTDSLLNAVWSFDTATNLWSWTSNSVQPSVLGTYGTKGVPSAENFPGSRVFGVSWVGLDGSLWLYGGNGYAQWGLGNLDDMWLIKQGVAPADGADLTGAWAPADGKCKTNKKGITKCRLKATLFVTNTGNEKTGKSFTRFFLSDDQVLDPGDVELKGKKVGKLKPGKGMNAKVKLKLDAPATGKYLIAMLDADGSVAETNELNNTVVSLPLP